MTVTGLKIIKYPAHRISYSANTHAQSRELCIWFRLSRHFHSCTHYYLRSHTAFLRPPRLHLLADIGFNQHDCRRPIRIKTRMEREQK